MNSCANVPCVLTRQRAQVQQVYAVFFQVKLFFYPVFYCDEKILFNNVETRRVTGNILGPDLSRALRHKGSSKIMISQSYLGFFIGLT